VVLGGIGKTFVVFGGT